MACGCGKARMAKPGASATSITPQASAQSRQTPNAQVISAATPYRQANVAPAHLQNVMRRKV